MHVVAEVCGAACVSLYVYIGLLVCLCTLSGLGGGGGIRRTGCSEENGTQTEKTALLTLV